MIATRLRPTSGDLVLRERGQAAVALPATVIAAYGAAILLAGIHLFRVRHSAR